VVSLLIIRLGFIIICAFFAYTFGGINDGVKWAVLASIGAGALVVLETVVRKVSLKGLSAATFGVIMGLILARMFEYLLGFMNFEIQIAEMFRAIITLISVYLGLTLGLKGREEFSLVIPYVRFKRQDLREESVVVDTSSIIDGRMLDIVKTGFLEAKFIVPRAVLNELQTLADSTDHLKRQKGKRGIEVLHSLKKEPNIEVVIHEEEVGEKLDVDQKVVKMGQLLDSKVLTTDYNLNRVAQLQGVKVLNINDLCNALKPILLPGEKFNLKCVKEGKEHNQAVGYLEDGTMVVVENGKWLIGKNTTVEVTSILQSPSGRIIFTKIAE